jgi:regulator of sirC expression with transglutaminase-like and TPR domain
MDRRSAGEAKVASDPATTVFVMDPSSRWREIMALPEDELPLDEAALLISAAADERVDVAAQLGRLDEAAGRAASDDVDAVCRLVFGTLGLRGDVRTYDDPRNSYLDQVLQRRLGIPISLSVVLMEIGRRCGVLLEGVGMPGHFLVRDPSQPDLLIDAFAAGRRLDRAACTELLHRVAGAAVDLRPAYLAPVGPRAILTRMLANLDQSFQRRDDGDGRRWVTRLRAAIPGQSPAELVALADTLAALGCRDEAAALLEALSHSPEATTDVARRLRTKARGLQAPFN